MALALPWVLVFASNQGVSRITGIVLTVVGVSACAWIAIHQTQLGDQYGFLESRFQVMISITLLLVVIEAARRAIGWPLPLVAVIALSYGLFGQHIPGEFGHSGTPLNSFLGTLTIAEGGIWGSLTGISVGVVAIFVIFGAVLNAGEAGRDDEIGLSKAACCSRGGSCFLGRTNNASADGSRCICHG